MFTTHVCVSGVCDSEVKFKHVFLVLDVLMYTVALQQQQQQQQINLLFYTRDAGRHCQIGGGRAASVVCVCRPIWRPCPITAACAGRSSSLLSAPGSWLSLWLTPQADASALVLIEC